MFLGHFGNLINPQAIQLLKANAYAAARAVLGPRAAQAVLFRAAEDYVKYVQPRTNRALTVFEIQHDYNFNRIAQAAKESESGKAKSTHDAPVDLSDYSLTGSIFGGIPNYALYGGIGVVGYFAYKKKWLGKIFKGKKSVKKTSRRRRIATSAVPLSIGGDI